MGKEDAPDLLAFDLADVNLMEFLVDAEGPERGQVLVAAEAVHSQLADCLRTRFRKTSIDSRFLKLADAHLSGDVFGPLRDL